VGWNLKCQRGLAREKSSTSAARCAQEVIDEGKNFLGLGSYPGIDRLQEVHPVRRGAPRVGPREGPTVAGFKGAEKVALAAPAVINFLPGAAGGSVGTGGGAEHFDPRVAPGRLGPPFVPAEHHAVWRRLGVEPLEGRLFFLAKSGSTFSAPNQVSCFRQRRPSSRRISPTRLRWMAMCLCSCR